MKIPQKPVGFNRRNEELSLLQERAANCGVMVIAGMPGIGKTVLAADLARELNRGVFSEAVAWIECRPGWESSDLFSAIQESLVRISGRKNIGQQKPEPQFLAETLEEIRFALFIDAFHLVEDRRTLEFVSQSRETLKNSLLVIVTGKKPELQPVELMDIFQHTVKGLKADEANAMLAAIFKEQNADIRFSPDLGLRLNGHPYSLKLAAGLILTGQVTPGELENSTDGITEQLEEYLLSKIWDSLDDEARDIVDHLALLRIPVNHELLESIRKIKSRKGLKLLQDYCLVELDRNGLCSLHSLLSSFAERRMESARKADIHRRIGLAFDCNETSRLEFRMDGYYHFFSAGEKEEAVKCLIRLCEHAGMSGGSLDGLVSLIDDALTFCPGIETDRLLDQKVKILCRMRRIAESEAVLLKIKNDAMRESARAFTLYQGGRYAEALPYYEKCSAGAASDRSVDAHFNRLLLAICYHYTGRSLETESVLEEIQKLGLDGVPDYSLILQYNFQAVFHFYKGDIYGAIKFIEKEIVLCRKLQALNSLTIALHNLAQFHKNLNMPDKALDLIREPIAISIEHNLVECLAMCHSLESDAYFMKGDYTTSLAAAEKGLSAAMKAGYTRYEAIELNQIADCSLRLGDIARAEAGFRKALEVINREQNAMFIAELSLRSAGFLLVTGRAMEAEPLIRNAMVFVEKSGLARLGARTFFFSYLFEKTCGNKEKAQDFLNKYHQYLNLLPPESQACIKTDLDWFDENSSRTDTRTISVFMRSEKRAVSGMEHESFRKRKHEFEFYTDFISREILIDGIEKPLFGRRVLMLLLQTFVADPSKSLTIGEIFQSVWEREYDQETDCNTFRMTLSRLRSELDKGKTDRFICAGDETGTYRFNTKCDYCIII
ncbi:MAG: NB-ARC domain-containing protein [Candidatus Wallbacteria bacterium]|nr:NB-ARC domain-containing protein [Candidatus Wallbacteria bacterium]